MSTLHVELLTKAREIIETEQLSYLCNALERAVRMAGTGFEQSQQIKGFVRELLGLSHTLDGWITDRLPEAAELYESDDTAYRKKIRATRLAWIDWLIEEWRDAP